jgi:hypothetical protein
MSGMGLNLKKTDKYRPNKKGKGSSLKIGK